MQPAGSGGCARVIQSEWRSSSAWLPKLRPTTLPPQYRPCPRSSPPTEHASWCHSAWVLWVSLPWGHHSNMRVWPSLGTCIAGGTQRCNLVTHLPLQENLVNSCTDSHRFTALILRGKSEHPFKSYTVTLQPTYLINGVISNLLQVTG